MQKEFNQQLFESTFNKHKELLKTRLNEFNRHPDERERQEWDRKIDRYNKSNKQRYECPTCKTPNALSAWQKQKGYQCDACADSEEGTGNVYEYKEHFKHLLKEALSPKGIETVKKWCEKFGNREAGIKIIDNILNKRIGLTSSDLPDTATFANGLDGIEDLLSDGNYNGAYEQAKETANEMIEDEGGMGEMDEAKEPKVDMISNSDRSKISKALQQQGADGNARFVDKSNGISAVTRALDSVGFNLDMVSGDILLGDKGSRMLPYRRKSIDGISEHPEIKNSRIVFNWDNLGGDTYEIQCYAS